MGATLAVTISNLSSLDFNCYVLGNDIMNYTGPGNPVVPAGSTMNIGWEKDSGVQGGGFLAHASVEISFWVKPGFVSTSGPMTTRWPGFKVMTVDYDDATWQEWVLSGVNGQATPAFPVALPFAIPSITASNVNNSASDIVIM
jgi:hypothetical protein